MKIILTLIALVLSLALSSQDQWSTLTGNSEEFQVEIFGSPETYVENLLLGTDTIIKYSWNAEISDTSHLNTYYSVAISTYPLEYVHSDSSFALIDGFLNSTVSSFTEDSTFSMVNTGFLLPQGYPGKYYKYKLSPANALLEYRSYLIQNQLIELWVISKPDAWFNTSKDKFFSSFTPLNRPRNTIDYGFTVIDTSSFEIAFPETPTLQDAFVDSELGKLHLRLHILERKASAGNVVFLSSELKYPDQFEILDENKEEFYTNAIDGSLQSTQGTLLNRQDITYNGFTGVEMQASIQNGLLTGTYRIFIIEKFMYMMGVLSTNKDLDKEALDFLDSFKKE